MLLLFGQLELTTKQHDHRILKTSKVGQRDRFTTYASTIRPTRTYHKTTRSPYPQDQQGWTTRPVHNICFYYSANSNLPQNNTITVSSRPARLDNATGSQHMLLLFGQLELTTKQHDHRILKTSKVGQRD